MKEWISIALAPTVRTRAFKVALLVGTIIAAINYSDKIVGGTFGTRDFIKLLMTYLVPYCVSTYSSVAATQEAARNGNE